MVDLLRHGLPVSFRVWQAGRVTKKNPKPDREAVWKRGTVQGWQESPSGKVYVSILSRRKNVYLVDLRDVDTKR